MVEYQADGARCGYECGYVAFLSFFLVFFFLFFLPLFRDGTNGRNCGQSIIPTEVEGVRVRETDIQSRRGAFR